MNTRRLAFIKGCSEVFVSYTGISQNHYQTHLAFDRRVDIYFPEIHTVLFAYIFALFDYWIGTGT